MLFVGTVGAIIIGDWKCGGAQTIYFQWRKAGGELFKVAVTEKKSSMSLVCCISSITDTLF